MSDVQILRRSGSDELDRWVEDTLRHQRYLPGLVDGVAVRTEHEETVQFGSSRG